MIYLAFGLLAAINVAQFIYLKKLIEKLKINAKEKQDDEQHAKHIDSTRSVFSTLYGEL